MTNLNTVSNALGQQMPGLSGDFAKVQAAVKPEVIQLFGEALLLANRNGGTFGAMAVGVGHDLDQLAARFTLAMDNKAVGQFAQATTADFAGLGTAIGNFGGIIGNLMKAVPGYAHILLGFGTEALQVGENITAVGEPLVAMGLKAHGALIYAGLLGTLLAKLAGGSFSLAAKAAGGLSTKLLGIATAAESGGFTGLSSVAEKASYGMAGAENAASKLSNISWGWVGIGVAALILLDKWMGDVTTQAQAFVQGWEAVIQNAPIGQVMTENAAALAAVDVQSQKATATLHQQSQAFTEVTKAQDKSSASIDKSGAGLAANRSGMTAYTATTRVATAAVETYNQGQQEFQAQGKLVSTRLQGLASDFGSTANAQGLLNAAGITTSQITDTNNQHWQQAVIQMEAQQAGFKEMELGAGRYGAAMNALNNPLVTLDSSMSKITQAQTTLMSTITGSESAFDTFQQGINTLGTDAKGAAPNLSGLGAAGLQMNSDFYTGINNAQSMISALEQQGITTKNLTKVVATQAGEMLHYAGSNAAARATVMSLINDAVGPGTVNFKDLDHWVGQNSTSLSTMNGIVGTTTVNAAGASGAIDTMSTQIFDQQLLLNSQASPALKTYADDIEKYGINASQTKSARQQLISDLEKTGDNANTAKGLVAGLTKGLNGLPTNVTTTITDKFTGLGKVAATQQILGESSSTSLGFMRFANAATGGLMKGGTPGKDSIPAMVMPGELIVPTHMVNAGAVDHLKGKLPGFASGGMVMGSGTVGAINSALSGSISGIQSTADTFAAQAGSAFSKAAAQAMAQEAAASSSGNIGGKLSGSLIQMLEQFASKKGWNSSQVQAWEGVIQLESGGSFTAKNPGSDAVGLAQFINGWSEYATYGGNSSPSGQVIAMGNYIAQRYGDPSNALAHEHQFHWYKDGGMVPKRGSGKNFAAGGSINEPVIGMGMNSGQTYRFGEGGRQEMVSPVNGNSSNSDNSPTHSQINTLISQNQQLISIMQQQPNNTAAAIAKNHQVSRVPR